MTLPLDPDDPYAGLRQARMNQIMLAERSVYDDYFARLARWLVEVRRGVLANVRPDPEGIFRFVPRWLREMTDFTMTTLLELVGAAYSTIYGPNYRYSQKPFVVNYLGDARNRLVRLPDEVYDEMVGQIAQGAMAGEGIPDIAARVDNLLTVTDNERWTNRATTVARTESGAALNAGRTAAFRQVADDLEQPFEQLWLATADARTRPTHRAADLQRIGLGGLFVVGESQLRFPGDPSGPAREVINCRCTTLLVEPGEVVDLSNRQFEDF